MSSSIMLAPVHNVLPKVQMWPLPSESGDFIQISEYSLCWDINSIVEDAKVFLNRCNEGSATQVFRRSFYYHNDIDGSALFPMRMRVPHEVKSNIGRFRSSRKYSILHIQVDETTHFCLEAIGLTNDIRLKPCRAGYGFQLFDFSKSFWTVNDEGTCVGSVGSTASNGLPYAVTFFSCLTTKESNIRQDIRIVTQAPIPVTPHVVTTMRIKDGCIDGSNPHKLELQICNDRPTQKWYWAFGHIRNVENGLCLSNEPDGPALVICNEYVKGKMRHDVLKTRNKFLWIYHSKTQYLINGKTGNCLAVSENFRSIVIQRCRKSSLFSIQNIESFSMLYMLESNGLWTEQTSASPRYIRKELRSFSNDEKKDLFAVMNKMHSMSSLLGYENRNQDFTILYYISHNWFKKSPHFLPWLRVFTMIFERNLQTLAEQETLRLPYWSWGWDSDRWYFRDSPDGVPGILTTGHLGSPYGGKIENREYCTVFGFMSENWKVIGNQCIERGYNFLNGNRDKMKGLSMMTENYLDKIVENAGPSYDGFRSKMELLVDAPFQRAIGGVLDNYELTPDDPLFWLHYNNIDRLFRKWQMMHSSTHSHCRIRLTSESSDDILAGLNVPARFGYASCIEYAPLTFSL